MRKKFRPSVPDPIDVPPTTPDEAITDLRRCANIVSRAATAA